ncbi:hypothetical protein PVAND_001066 [Polypedilum vanderplanki]|uniref:Bulb-type lectin domain-containing protein n=1 Tax=Polypedilum vanderplanki TaxID=319348 RepID=A0A9J6BMF3_POLVA|nr:hypothetical protein PVAND_001066 [Polypedilum vanderplanki]
MKKNYCQIFLLTSIALLDLSVQVNTQCPFQVYYDPLDTKCVPRYCGTLRDFDPIRCVCRCKSFFICPSPKIWSKNLCRCECPDYLNIDYCINQEIFDEDTCSCICPYSASGPPNGCSANQRWSLNQCNCVPYLNVTTSNCGCQNNSTTISTTPKPALILNQLNRSQCLNPGDSIISSNGCFTFLFQQNGNVELYRSNDSSKILFQSNTANSGANQACLQNDGVFVVSKGAIVATQNILYEFGPIGDHLVVGNDGNLIIYNTDNSVIVWQSNTSQTDQTCGILTKTTPTVPTTFLPGPPRSCALWMPYLNDIQPTINGYAVGKSWTNSTIYIGRAWYGGQFIPARVDVTKYIEGVYVSWGGGEAQALQDSEYMVLPNGCSCVWLSPDIAVNRVGLVATKDFMVGRVNFTNGRIAISKVTLNAPFTQWYADSTGNNQMNTASEVLVCSSTIPITVKPQITLSGGACSAWGSYNNDDAPSYSGLSAGTSLVNNSTAYLGRGFYDNLYTPGRIQIGSTNGTYLISTTGEQLIKTFVEYLVTTNGCKCAWIPIYAGIMNTPGVVRSIDNNFHFIFGRKVFSNGQVAITRIQTTDFTEWYIDDKGVYTFDTATNALICASPTVHTPNPVLSCALWMPYYNDDQPTINGYAVGTSWKNSTVYIGRGWYGGQFMPGRVDVTKNIEGVYVDWFSELQILQDSEYMVLPNGCSCVWLSPNIAVNRVGLVTTKDFMIGRVNFTNGGIAISKVSLNAPFTQWYIDSIGNNQMNTASEVLVCESTNPIELQPTVTFSSTVCAGWTSYKNNLAPTYYGFAAGPSYKNTTAYVGRGFAENQFQPGRIQTEIPAQIYLFSSTGEITDQFAEYLVVPTNCSCQWISPYNGILSRPGLIHSPDENFHYLVGRVNLTSTQVAISKVKSSDFTEWYMVNANTNATDIATQVLVCEKI